MQGESLDIVDRTDYIAFCGGARPDWLAQGLIEGRAGERIKVQASSPHHSAFRMTTEQVSRSSSESWNHKRNMS